MNNEQAARLAYETIAGRCCDNHWYKTKRLLREHSLEVSVENVQFFARLRQSIPRSAIGTKGLLTCYAEAKKILDTTKLYQGSEVLALLQSYGVCPHQTTVSRWFRKLGGYRRTREYTPEQLKVIFTQAFLYKAQYLGEEYGQQSSKQVRQAGSIPA